MTLHHDEPVAEAQIGATIDSLRIEHASEALGVGTARPRLSWTVAAAKQGWMQLAYAIEARGPDGRVRGRTGRVNSDQSVLVPWPFAPLVSRERCSLRVKVWAREGQETAWSEPVIVEAGLLDIDSWSARFVTPAWDEDTSRPQPCPFMRHSFTMRAPVRAARLYATSHGVYEAWINGQKVGDHVLAPGWTSYRHRLRYQTFDVTTMLRSGDNVIGAVLGDGWYRGRLGFGGGIRNRYGDRLALLAQLEIEYEDGSREAVVTDEHWRATTGPLLLSDLYDGETYDARLELEGWAEPGYDEHEWVGVRVIDQDLSTLVAPSGPPVRRTERIRPVTVGRSPSGKTILDFGQNLVGRLRITVTGRVWTNGHAAPCRGPGERRAVHATLAHRTRH